MITSTAATATVTSLNHDDRYGNNDNNHDYYKMKRNVGLAKPPPAVSDDDNNNIMLSSWMEKLHHFLLVYVVFQIGFPVFIIVRIIRITMENSFQKSKNKNTTNNVSYNDFILHFLKWWSCYVSHNRTLIRKAHKDPIDLTPEDELIDKVWKLESAKHYLSKEGGKEEYPLEWQKREGYCGSTTLRCILKSYPSYPTQFLPEPSSGFSEPENFAQKIQDLMKKKEMNYNTTTVVIPTLQTEIIRPKMEDDDDGMDYDNFLIKLRHALQSPNCRVGVNYLRGALMGIYKTPSWIPIHCFMSMFMGHFSPIIGLLEGESQDEPLVAVFDVNATYGLYLVEASRLYDAVKAKDLSTGKSRGIVIVSEQLPK